MNIEQKKKLMQFLYPNPTIRSFLINDMYRELLQILPMDKIFTTENENPIVREQNYKSCIFAIKEFIITNPNYMAMLTENYYRNDIDDIIEDVFTGFVFFISQTNDYYKDIDIFKDKQSVCYTLVSIIDI